MGKRANHEGTIRKRKDGTFEARITVGYVVGEDGKGKQKQQSKYFKTRKEAAAWLVEMAHSQNTGTFVPPDKITVEDWTKKWLETYAKPGVGDTSLEKYERVINVHIIPSLGRTPLQKLIPSDVQFGLIVRLKPGYPHVIFDRYT